MVQNLNEVVKALKEYNETQKEKHRQVDCVDLWHDRFTAF